MKNTVNQPQFLQYMYFAPQMLKALYHRHVPLKYIFDINLYKAIFSTKKLYIHRIVKYNNKYFFSITIPSFPSKAYKQMYADGGLNFPLSGTAQKKHFETLILGISDNCLFHCSHCYEKDNLVTRSNVTPDAWKKTISYFQQQGVSIIVLSGGEPLLNFYNTIELLKHGNKDLSDFHLHTSGYSLTYEKALMLKEAGLTAAAVGLDHPDPMINDKIRGKDSFRIAVDALNIFNRAGIMTYVNLCAGKELLLEDNLLKHYDLLKDLNVSFIELLEPKPCGGYSDNAGVLLSSSEKEKLRSFAFNSSFDKKFRDYPVVYYVNQVEHEFGCNMGGLSLLYIDTKGNVNPCVFVPVSFGNIMKEDIEVIFQRIRSAIPAPVHKKCPSLLLSEDMNIRHPIHYGDVEDKWYTLLYERKEQK